jgi:hypothetical protein
VKHGNHVRPRGCARLAPPSQERAQFICPELAEVDLWIVLREFEQDPPVRVNRPRGGVALELTPVQRSAIARSILTAPSTRPWLKSSTHFRRVDFGRRALILVAALRPLIGTVLGVCVAFVFEATLVYYFDHTYVSTRLEFLDRAPYIVALAAFVAGFGERWLDILQGRREPMVESAVPS